MAERSLRYPSYTNFRDRRWGAGLLITILLTSPEEAASAPKGGIYPLSGRSFRVEAAVGDLEPLRDASFRERGRRARAELAFWARERCEPC